MSPSRFPLDRSRLLSAAVLLLALAVRLPHLGWGLPEIEEEALPAKKAFEMWGWNEGHLVLDPQTAGWPSFSFYVHLAVQHLQYAAGRLQGRFAEPLDFFVAYRLDPSATILWARWTSLLATLGVVWVGIRLGRRVGGARGALTAGLLLAISPLLVQHAQSVTPDVLLTLFAALALDRLVAVLDRGRSRDYVLAAAYAGLGAATKYTPVLLTSSLYAIHLLRRRSEGRSLSLAGLDDRRLGLAALTAVLAFVLASPYTFADLDVLRRDFAYQALHMSQGHFGQEVQGVGYLHYLTRVLPRALGWPALGLGLAVLLGRGLRRPGPLNAVALGFLPFYVVLGALNTHFDRYMLPALLPLAVGAGAGVSALSRGTRRGKQAVTVVVLAILVFSPARALFEYHARQGQPSTQRLAREWIEEHLDPRDTRLAMERYTAQLPADDRGRLRQEKVFARLNEAQRRVLLQRRFFDYQLIPMYAARVQLSAFYYDLRHYLPYTHLVISGAVRRRYEADPQRFPEQIAFYRDLERFTELVAHFAPGGDRRGPEIWIRRFDPAQKQRLLAERGPLQPGFYRPWIDRLHAPHFLGFVENVALHASKAAMPDVAWLYERALLETCPPEKRRIVRPRAAYTALLAGDLEAADSLYQQVLADDPQNAAALGNLGYVREKQGRLEEAAQAYRRCIEIDRQGQAATWARQRLDAVEAALGPADQRR